MPLRLAPLILAALVAGAGPAGAQIAAPKRAPASDSAPSPTNHTVQSVTAGVDLADYRGTCPARLTFSATIVTAGVPKVPIVYQWIRSDGVKGPKKSLKMRSTAEVVIDTWKVGAAGDMMRVWKALKILSPTPMTSNEAVAAVLCH